VTPIASSLQLWGAGGFGALIGWYLYYINRRRTDQVRNADLVSVIGAMGDDGEGHAPMTITGG
jgi:hypothetical protein